MISGFVTDLHAIVRIIFLLPNGSRFPIEFVLDTGFTGDLCLPEEAVKLIGIPFLYNLPARLADNSSRLLPLYKANVLWNDKERIAHVLATGERPLLGTGMLASHELIIQFAEGGLVTIDTMQG
ncbi:MAG: clan AA aspartic protease [Alkalinema sp. CACIAM 70d]|nr:MAG: clan AA aspartic protease [Alkalinema sp. CACIAM 70d]